MIATLLTIATLLFGWGSTDTRYPRQEEPSDLSTRTLRLRAWRGETVSAQAVLYTPDSIHAPLPTLRMPGGLSGEARWVGYVWTDELNKDRRGGCGLRPDKTQWDSSLVADRLFNADTLLVAGGHCQPVWLTLRVPTDAKPGTYRSTLTLCGDGPSLRRPRTLSLQVEVVDSVLPAASEWPFHLDMWQNPFAVARYHRLPLWSDAHLDAVAAILRMLADVGQRTLTTSIMHRPWNAQTYDPYDSMIGRTRLIDGSWQYDYTVFDRYVSTLLPILGPRATISCYTLIPWQLTFDYYDQATSRTVELRTAPGDSAYTSYWLPFLRDFATHLRERGWFERTVIAMDERPMEQMRQAIAVIKEADPSYKISLAGNYHAEIADDLYYLSIPYGHLFPSDVLAQRRSRGQISTMYTCCSEPRPNLFTFSPPSEAAETVLHAYHAGYDGWLRWAVNSWPCDPDHDSRFWAWAAGDTYSIYPGPCSSIRFERLREGLQAVEKEIVLQGSKE